MNTKIKTSLYVGEGIVGYRLIQYVPKNVLLKKYNGVVIAGGLIVTGVLTPCDMGGNHILAVGLGAGVNEILDVVGLK
ncbi:hypothetical protein J4226_00235 [Candidatus Pacearchaeota archaeon]|nr:hypothetical protein [Candidatus Pacearchaeota archaeon]